METRVHGHMVSSRPRDWPWAPRGSASEDGSGAEQGDFPVETSGVLTERLIKQQREDHTCAWLMLTAANPRSELECY